MSAETPNPYQPPKARVEDREGAAPPPPRPRRVTLGVVLLWISLGIECLLGFQIVPGILEELGDQLDTYILGIVVVATVVIYGVGAWLILMTALRRNWARIIYLVLYLLGTPSFLMSIGAAFEESLPVAIGSTASNALQVVALVMLFLPVSNAWFRWRPGAA